MLQDAIAATQEQRRGFCIQGKPFLHQTEDRDWSRSRENWCTLGKGAFDIDTDRLCLRSDEPQICFWSLVFVLRNIVLALWK